MAEITAPMTVRIVALGEAGYDEAGKPQPSVTLGTEDGDVLIYLDSMEACRRLAPLLGTDVEATISIPLPEKERRRA